MNIVGDSEFEIVRFINIEDSLAGLDFPPTSLVIVLEPPLLSRLKLFKQSLYVNYIFVFLFLQTKLTLSATSRPHQLGQTTFVVSSLRAILITSVNETDIRIETKAIVASFRIVSPRLRVLVLSSQNRIPESRK